MDKEGVASILDELGMMLELQGENPFRCLAYHNAARALRQLAESLPEIVAAGRLSEIPGIGQTLQGKITQLVETDKLPFYEELQRKTPPGLLEMLRLPGLGPKKIKVMRDELGIESLDQLKEACAKGDVAALKGFGAKTQQKILEGIQFLGSAGRRVRIDQAETIAQFLLESLKDQAGIMRMAVCGSLRRRKETINDIDILVSSNKPGPIMDRFVKLPGVAEVVGHGETKSSVVMDRRLLDGESLRLNADLRIVSDAQFPFALNYFTGSKEHNIAMRARAQERGLKLNEYELAGSAAVCRDEADLYRILDLDYVEPELREQTGELEAAAKHALPQLVSFDDLRGIFHCHTNWSDGTATLEEMARAAQKCGFKYLGIGDHSKSLTVANGLTAARVRMQYKEIDSLNARLHGFRLFKGTECDILADGRLDYDNELLATCDYVVASVHSHFGQSESEMTQRILKAVSHPRVTMLGHATGRLLLRRDGYKVDLDAVLREAARHGTLVEINADPHRLDLDWVHCKRAKALGVQLVINPDAHSQEGLQNVRYGVDVARRGWLSTVDVFNTKSTAAVAKDFAARAKKSAD